MLVPFSMESVLTTIKQFAYIFFTVSKNDTWNEIIEKCLMTL